MQISRFKKALSFIVPVTIKKISGSRHPVLILQLFCNQYMLSTRDAIYSYGTFYTPFRKSFHYLRKELNGVKSFLLLGTGLGSALKILQTKYHRYPVSVLVDNDKNIIDLSINFMNLNTVKNVQWIYSDALHFMQTDNRTFDLIGVDIFKDTFIPKDFKQEEFFALCKSKLNLNGHIIFNMIFNSSNEKVIILDRLHRHFRHVHEISFKVNYLFICKS